MAGRGVNITARVVFFVCGAVSIVVAAIYAMMQGSDLPSQSWIIFTVVFGSVGAGNALAAILLTVGVFFTPHEWNLSGYLGTFLLCPSYIVRVTLDPNAVGIFLIFAPIDAAVYGAVGSVIGFWRAARMRA
jgi:hypothetical protein